MRKRVFVMGYNSYFVLLEDGTKTRLTAYCNNRKINRYAAICKHFGGQDIFEIPEADLKYYLSHKTQEEVEKPFAIKKNDGQLISINQYFNQQQAKQKELLTLFMKKNNLKEVDELVLTFKDKSISVYHMDLNYPQLSVIYKIMTERNINIIAYDDLMIYLRCLGYIKEEGSQSKPTRK